MCHGICGVLVHVADGVVTKVTGDPECPTSRGYICAKGKASVELLYHPDRLKHPLKRAGVRGEDKWERISWDEALDTIADKFSRFKEEYGAESIVGAYGTGRPYYVFFQRFLNSLGTPNKVTFSHICYAPRLAASAMTCGTLPICDYYGFGGIPPKCVVVWGCNITETGASDGMCGYQLTQTLKREAKLIVIDPRKTDIASKADHWVQLRPGTDDALALGMLHTIIEEGLFDKDFVENWTVGFDELAERVKQYPPDRVEEITWVPAETICDTARLYATTKPACIQWGVALDQNINSFQTIRAVMLLSGITGNIDIPGGDVFWVPPENVVIQSPRLNPDITLVGKLSREAWEKKIGTGSYRVLTQSVHPRYFYDTVLTEKPYPVKALFLMGTNSFLGHSYSARMAEAFKKIDFTVATDLFMTPTTQMVDIVLPAASWLETDDVADLHFVWCVLVRQKVTTIGECRDDKQILIDLAHRMGMEDCFPWKNVREYCDWVLKDSGIPFDDFKEEGIIQGRMQYRKYLKDGFRTPSGKFELRCSKLETMGYDPLPSVVEPPESPYSTPDLFEEYPLVITTGARIQAFFHTEGRQIPSLRRRNPDPLLEIHPETAKDLEIKEGDWVWIESPRGRIRQKARLTEGIHPGVVSAQHGWWFPEKDPPEYGFKESSVSMLTADLPCDPHTGSESWRSFLCKVYKA
jgi:anaerobic selenocysteine-containing dehydrogenase